MRGNLSCVQLIMSKQQEQMIVILLRLFISYDMWITCLRRERGNINILHFKLYFTHFAKKSRKVLLLGEAFKSITRRTVTKKKERKHQWE